MLKNRKEADISVEFHSKTSSTLIEMDFKNHFRQSLALFFGYNLKNTPQKRIKAQKKT